MTLKEKVAQFKDKIKTLTGQEHLEIQFSNDYRKLAWYAYYIDTLEDYRQKLIKQGNYQDKHKQSIDSEIKTIQEDYDELFDILEAKQEDKPLPE